LRIVKKTEIELDPLETATELLSARVDVLRRVVKSSKVDINALQLALQGSVRLQVHGGVPEIVKTFLTPLSSPYVVFSSIIVFNFSFEVRNQLLTLLF
jgi:hypothetical protein